MAKTTQAEIRRALQAVREQPAATSIRSLSYGERAANKLVADWLRKSGLDTRSLAALQRQRSDELDRALDKRRTTGGQRAPRRLDFAHASVARQAGIVQQFAAAGGFFPHPSITLDRPTAILAEPNIGIIVDSSIAPFESSARIRVDTRRPSIDKLNFIYKLRNDTDSPVVIDAVTFMSASGRLHLRESGQLIGFSIGSMDVKAQLEVLALTQPVTSINHDTQFFRRIIAISKQFFIDGNADVGVSAAKNLAATHCAIPPRTTVLFVASLIVDCDFNPGRAVADFESGSFQVRCPLVVVSFRSGLPPSILGG